MTLKQTVLCSALAMGALVALSACGLGASIGRQEQPPPSSVGNEPAQTVLARGQTSPSPLLDSTKPTATQPASQSSTPTKAVSVKPSQTRAPTKQSPLPTKTPAATAAPARQSANTRQSNPQAQGDGLEQQMNELIDIMNKIDTVDDAGH